MTAEEKIEEIRECLKDKINYLKLGGSRSLPFIHNPKDYDVIVVCQDEAAIEEAKALFLANYNKKELVSTYKIDLYFRTVAQNEGIAGTVYPYLLHFSEENYTKEIIEDEIKQAIIDRVMKFDEKLESYHNLSLYDSKLWYYIYTTVCILKNNSYELTTEQIENINILHDRKKEDLDIRKRLIEEIRDEVKQWLI